MFTDATYHSYDIHGNVDTLVQDFGYGQSGGVLNVMNTSGNRFKKIVYNYDLISGKVNQVSYQPGQPDAYYPKYSYDAENRLTDVYTGRDSTMLLLFPEREAHYSYYKHGPLMQTILGQLQVQKQDYAYTLQGWLKGINPTMGGTLANGTDTTEAFPVTQDAYGFSLHYYKNDYRAIGYAPQATSVLSALATNAAPLYNGNIAAMAVNIPQLSATGLYNYHYDQLNRIVAMDMYNGLNPNAGTFTAVSDTSYKERVSYDPNGNILGYLRNGNTGSTMDSLNYKYYANTNQLSQVKDNVSSTKYTSDIDNQNANNYTYDATGNMISAASDTITNITWNVYGKIATITKNGRQIKYTYDASGNRIMKQTATDTTAYVRDATGNVMSVYYRPAGGSLIQSEMHLYGSSRLGMATQHLAPDTSVVLIGGFGSGIKSIFTRGEKFFELSNHLGNVLATVSDKKVGHTTDGITIDYYNAEVVSAQDYYPGGMLMPGRKYSIANTNYRYGFNGKENDNEVKGEGNQQDYGMRIYDPRLGRFLSVDPITRSYPMLTPYQFASNRPIDGVDMDGKEWSVATVDGVTTFTVKVRVYNESKAIKKIDDINRLLNGGLDKRGKKIEGYKDYAENSFSKDIGSDKFRINIQFELMQGPSCDYDVNNEFQLILRDVSSKDNGDGTISYAGGATYVGHTQKNNMYSTLSVDGNKLTDRKLLFRNFLHELLHTGGLNHPWKKDNGINDLINNPEFLKKLDTDKKFRKFVGAFFNVDTKKLLKDMKQAGKENIMNSDEPRGDVPIGPTHDPNDNEIRKSQYEKIEKTVSTQQPHD